MSDLPVMIRRVEPADYPLIQRWQNDPEIFSLMDYERPFSAADIVASEENAARKGIPFIIEAGGTPIGRIGLNGFRHRDRTASLYVFIGEKAAWGSGNGRAAIELALRYAFGTLNLRLVQLWTLAHNERAIHLYERIGFSEDARLRDRSWIEGRYVDHLVMSITADEFASRSGT
ncbi:MAG TPA: GNAT family protein [Actinomycetota bacterium]|nr:GNAT family protein [Actinomycetota bacterium]